MTKCHTIIAIMLMLLLPSCQRNGHVSKPSSEKRTHIERSADSIQWRAAVEEAKHFLFDPNSPYRDEEAYIPVLESIMESEYASAEEKAEAGSLLPRLKLNRPGTVATDFSIAFKGGRINTLHEILDGLDVKYTILLFSNPGCDACKETIDFLESDRFRHLQKEGLLAVVCVYPDEDQSLWEEYLPQYPQQWICGYDPYGVLLNDQLYWLRAIPSFYLLDGDGRVILKDASEQRLASVLLR